MTHNVVVRTKTGGFHQHYGRENTIAHNVLAEARVQQVQRTRTEEHRSFTFSNNIVYWTGEGALLGSNWRDDGFVLDRNVYWNAGRPLVFPGGLTLEQWREQRGQDLGSVAADPLFVDAAAGDFRLRQGSPALAAGFEAWDPERAGRSVSERITADLPPVPAGFEP